MTRIPFALMLACVLMAGAGCDKEPAPEPEPQTSMPVKGVPFTDSLYHTTIVRITDKDTDNYAGPGIENEYARSDPENSNGTIVVLRANDGEWYLYDRATCHLRQHLAGLGSVVEPEPRWDPLNPSVFRYIYATELRSYDVTTGTASTIHDFKNDYPDAYSISTKTEGDASLDHRYWCFMVEDTAYNVLAVVVYDLVLDSIIGRKQTFPDNLNWASMDMTGRHCVIGYESRAAQAFPIDFSNVVDLPPGASGHMDLALTSTGTDVMVYQSNSTDWISMVDLDGGAETQLVEIPFGTNTDIGLHFSGNCDATPGWVLVSTYGAKNPPSGQSHSWMDNLLYMVELKASPRVVKLARTQCYTGESPVSNYFAEAFATINHAGTRVYFGSNWGDLTTADYTDAYELTMPPGWNQ